MAQQLLDRAEVGAAVQQMGRERVAQRVRVGAALQCRAARPDLQWRRTSEVDSRRPDFDKNNAGSARSVCSAGRARST